MRAPPPSLGNDLDTIHNAWHTLSQQPISQHNVSAFIPFEGRFAYRGNDIVRLMITNGLPTYQSATPHELAMIDDAIQNGTLQIEARTSFLTDELVRTYHQATGRPLPRERAGTTPSAR